MRETTCEICSKPNDEDGFCTDECDHTPEAQHSAYLMRRALQAHEDQLQQETSRSSSAHRSRLNSQ